jgi:hypothetical protein
VIITTGLGVLCVGSLCQEQITHTADLFRHIYRHSRREALIENSEIKIALDNISGFLILGLTCLRRTTMSLFNKAWFVLSGVIDGKGD